MPLKISFFLRVSGFLIVLNRYRHKASVKQSMTDSFAKKFLHVSFLFIFSLHSLPEKH